MRNEFCKFLVERSSSKQFAFLTGDLGYMALEPLQKSLGKYFINAGVAEQNMITVAAAMTKAGIETWVYSIAPFCYARPFEQIRNDICFHGLPVKMVGNGAGYGYGVMGPTHHAIEDYGVMCALPGMSIYSPIFQNDLAPTMLAVANSLNPTYLRLGRAEILEDYSPPQYQPWRELLGGEAGVVISFGPISASYIAALTTLPMQKRPSLWGATQLPLNTNLPPNKLIEQIKKGGKLIVAEEHVEFGSLGSQLALHLLKEQISIGDFVHLCAKNHVFDQYGSQSFLRKKTGIDAATLMQAIAP